MSCLGCGRIHKLPAQERYCTARRLNDAEREAVALRTEASKLAGQLADYVCTVDAMKLQLILSGALSRPKVLSTPVEGYPI